jgi:hypothetical protein
VRRRLFLGPLAAATLAPVAAAQATPQLVLFENGPWLTRIRGDAAAPTIDGETPIFALYDDGLVLYLERLADLRVAYRQVRLSRAAVAEQVIDAALFEALFTQLERYYNAAEGQQARTVSTLFVHALPRTKRIRVDGNLRTSTIAFTRVPRALIALILRLADFRVPDAAPWMPQAVELTFTPVGAAASVLDWTLPTSADPRAPLVLTAAQYNTLRARVHGRANAAVRLAGRTWNFRVRFVIPGEELWLR